MKKLEKHSFFNLNGKKLTLKVNFLEVKLFLIKKATKKKLPFYYLINYLIT